MRQKPPGLVILTAVAAKPGKDRTDLARFQSQLGEAKVILRHEPQSLLGCCWVSWFRSRRRCYSRQRIVDASTYKQNLVKLLFQLRRLWKPRSLIDTVSAQRLASAFILSRVDYCNAVLVGLPTSILAPLQRVLNAAARFVTGATSRTHVNGIMKSLHWLLITYRICFKLSVLIYARHSQWNQSFVSNRYNNTDLVICQDIVSFVQQWRLNTTSLAPGQNLETELSLLLDLVNGMLCPLI